MKMKKINLRVLLLLILAFTIGCSSDSLSNEDTGPSVKMKVASYNVRLPAAADVATGNDWDIRKEHVAALMIRHDFDIVGIQEPYQITIDDLDILMEDYDKITAPYATRSFLAIYFKKELFEVLDSGMFWLSETPDIPSEGWDSDEKRVCHWAKFKEKETAKEFYFFNTHFYHKLVTARKNSGPLVVRKIEEIADDVPVIFVGDLNSSPTTSQIERIKVLLNDVADVTETPRSGPENTGFPGGVFEGEPHTRIDYIFVSKDIKVLDYTVHDDKYGDDRYPSDHLPISSNIVID